MCFDILKTTAQDISKKPVEHVETIFGENNSDRKLTGCKGKNCSAEKKKACALLWAEKTKGPA